MKVLASYNIKGGVGKTAAAVNLAYLAASEGARTLLWDLDPQAAATYYFRVKPKVKGGGFSLFGKKKSLANVVKGTDFPNLDLLPADLSYRHLDVQLDGTKKPTRTLQRRIKALRGDYDYVFLDCPPSLSLMSENVFSAADALLVPVIPTVLSVRTLEQLERFLAEHGYRDVSLLAFFSMVDQRKRLHRDITAELPEQRRHLLNTTIPSASTVEQMGIERRPIESFDPRSAAAQAFRDLWHEIQRRLNQ